MMAAAEKPEVKEITKMSVAKESFGQTPDRQSVILYTLKNPNGFTTKIMNYGATLVSLKTSKQDSNLTDIPLLSI